MRFFDVEFKVLDLSAVSVGPGTLVGLLPRGSTSDLVVPESSSKRSRSPSIAWQSDDLWSLGAEGV
jgi:hypothetical protein